MRRHVFSKTPKFCEALKPGLILVKCRKCGRAHEEYFGPPDRDENGAELEMLRAALGRACAIIHALGAPRHDPAPARARATHPRAQRRH